MPVSELLLGAASCPACHKIVGVHWLAAAVANTIIAIVTLASTAAIFVQQGVYAAILWFSVPIGALSYLKARYCPLEIKRQSRDDAG